MCRTATDKGQREGGCPTTVGPAELLLLLQLLASWAGTLYRSRGASASTGVVVVVSVEEDLQRVRVSELG